MIEIGSTLFFEFGFFVFFSIKINRVVKQPSLIVAVIRLLLPLLKAVAPLHRREVPWVKPRAAAAAVNNTGHNLSVVPLK
jgi:hypothetical protein